MSDFAGTEYDFAMGSVKGLRSWSMDSLGRLVGVTHREVWLPGVNVSRCTKVKRVPCPEAAKRKVRKEVGLKGRRGRKYDDGYYYGLTFRWEPVDVLPSGPLCDNPSCSNGQHDSISGHHFDADCECGFWAYDELGFTEHGEVTGVIEAFGKVTIGTKGFRAEKARVVALSMRRGSATLCRSTQHRLAELYPDARQHATYAEMLDAHPEVLKQWEPVGEDFWTKADPTPPKSDDFLWSYRRVSLTRAVVQP